VGNRCVTSLAAGVIISKSSTGKVMNRGPEMMATLIVAAATRACEVARLSHPPAGRYTRFDMLGCAPLKLLSIDLKPVGSKNKDFADKRKYWRHAKKPPGHLL
jgi:hypothetical protein